MSNMSFEYINSCPMKNEPLDQDESDLADMQEANKCGEVVAQYGGSFILICGFCRDIHENIITFGSHINQKHNDKMMRINSLLRSSHDEVDRGNQTPSFEEDMVWSPPVSMESLYPIDKVDAVQSEARSIKNEALGVDQTTIQVPAEQPLKYVCDHCGQSYKHKGRLQSHQNKNSCRKVLPGRTFDMLAPTSCQEELHCNTTPKRRQLRNSNKQSTVPETKKPTESQHHFRYILENREELKEEFSGRSNDMKEESVSEQDKPPDDNPSSDEVQVTSKGKASKVQSCEATAPAKRFPCGTCERTFKSKQARTHHIGRFHDEQSPAGDSKSLQQYLRCKYCNTQFDTKAECTAHEGTHIGEKRFICWYCPHTFRTNYGRKRHMRVHTGERPFKCTECPKAFPHMVQLDYHIRKHKNLREFSCAACGKAFFRKFELSLHERKHTGYRPLVCEDCGKTFNVMSELNEHRKRHTDKKDWKCDTCGKCFYSKWTLKDHMAGHSSETPFECEVCGRKFSRAKALKKHKKLHSDVKAYVCNICGKAYAQDSGLYAHRKTHGMRTATIDISHVNIVT